MVEWRSGTPRERSALAPVSFIDPARPIEADKVPAGPDWLDEIKHDGYRLQIHKHGDRVRLFTFSGYDWTKRYPWIVEGARSLDTDHAIIDAEAVVADDNNGIAIFDKLVERIHDDRAFAYAFDLLAVDGEDIRALPIEHRKAQLAKLLPRRFVTSRAQSGIRLSEHLEGEGDLVFLKACVMGLEGIVSKRLGSKYRSGRCTSWIKVKNKQAPGYTRFREEAE